MDYTVEALAISAISIGFIHTLLGPDHYLPFIVLSKSRKWTLRKTLWITFICGLGHVLGSIALGIIGVSIGVGINKLEVIESFRGDIAAWILFLFGMFYFLWGMYRGIINKPHAHVHAHSDGKLHKHIHTHNKNHDHLHNSDKPVKLTPWFLFIIFVLGPCEALIPLLIYPAAHLSFTGMVFIALLFGLTTIATMMAIVGLLVRGYNMVNVSIIEKYSHAIAGFIISLSGAAILFLGL